MSNFFFFFCVSVSQEVWQDEMMEGLVEEEEGAEGEGEAGEREGMLPNKRPVLAGDKKTLQQRRRERERKTKVLYLHKFNLHIHLCTCTMFILHNTLGCSGEAQIGHKGTQDENE